MAAEKIASVTTPLPGPRSAELIAKWRRFEADTTGFQAPVVWDRARGVVVADVDGNRYIDWTSGVLVANIGHCHPKLVAAVQDAVTKLINNYECPTEARIAAAETLVNHLPEPAASRSSASTVGFTVARPPRLAWGG